MLENIPTPIFAPLHQPEAARNSPSRIAIKANGPTLFPDPAEVMTPPASKKSRLGPQASTLPASKEVRSSVFPAHIEKTSNASLRSGPDGRFLRKLTTRLASKIIGCLQRR